MALAEEGGNQPQRVLLIGGPKHGEYINLPKDQDSYEFTSFLSYDTPPNTPGYTTHVYKLDPKLNVALQYHPGPRANYFTHEVLWDSPHQGGFNLYALRDALRTVEEAKQTATDALDSVQRTRDKLNASEEECEVWQNKYEALLQINHSQEDRLQLIRQELELVGGPLMRSVQLTGHKYVSAWDAD